VREILQDIIEEDKRAGQIIVRMRAMLKKEHATLAAQDLNQIVSEVLGIMHSELLLRNATSVTKLGSQLPLIKGDRIRLQQVLVNLVVNACDAMITIPPPKRQVTIETERLDENFVQLSVGDCGPGFVADGTGSMFEPFRSSKPNGLGLGLPICRSIIESHGGRFWVANHPAGGAIVRLTLLVEK